MHFPLGTSALLHFSQMMYWLSFSCLWDAVSCCDPMLMYICVGTASQTKHTVQPTRNTNLKIFVWGSKWKKKQVRGEYPANQKCFDMNKGKFLKCKDAKKLCKYIAGSFGGGTENNCDKQPSCKDNNHDSPHYRLDGVVCSLVIDLLLVKFCSSKLFI
jgi:hypothetical protein